MWENENFRKFILTVKTPGTVAHVNVVCVLVARACPGNFETLFLVRFPIYAKICIYEQEFPAIWYIIAVDWFCNFEKLGQATWCKQINYYLVSSFFLFLFCFFCHHFVLKYPTGLIPIPGHPVVQQAVPQHGLYPVHSAPLIQPGILQHAGDLGPMLPHGRGRGEFHHHGFVSHPPPPPGAPVYRPRPPGPGGNYY